jgi:hypothetical protein
MGAVMGLSHAWGVYLRQAGEISARLAKRPVALMVHAYCFALEEEKVAVQLGLRRAAFTPYAALP